MRGREDVNVCAVTAIAARGGSVGLEELAVERDAAVPAITSANMDDGVVEESLALG